MRTILLLSLLLLGGAYAQTDIVIGPVTYTIDGTPTHGTYINGDPWVLLPFTIVTTTVSEDVIANEGAVQCSATRSGTTVMPAAIGSTAQGFDDRMDASFSSNQFPLFPREYTTECTLVTGVSRSATNASQPLLYNVALTAVAVAPAANAFRPPLMGRGDKASLWTEDDIDYSVFLQMENVSGGPTLGAMQNAYRWPQPITTGFYKSNYWLGVNSCPHDGKNYGREFAMGAGKVAWALNCAGTNAEKRIAAINVIQAGIDMYGFTVLGGDFTANGGWMGGRKLIAAIAAVALDDADMLAQLQVSGSSNTNGNYAEDQQHFYVSQNDIDTPRAPDNTGVRPILPYTQDMLGMPEWGGNHLQDKDESGSNWSRIYRVVVGANMVSNALVAKLMGLEEIWDDPAFFEYYERVQDIHSFGAQRFSGTPGWVHTAWDLYYWQGAPPPGPPPEAGESIRVMGIPFLD